MALLEYAFWIMILNLHLWRRMCITRFHGDQLHKLRKVTFHYFNACFAGVFLTIVHYVVDLQYWVILWGLA